MGSDLLTFTDVPRIVPEPQRHSENVHRDVKEAVSLQGSKERLGR